MIRFLGSCNAGQGVEEAWTLEGVESPHDLAVVAAPVRLAIAERPLAVLVGETRASGSKLHKFVIMPAGEHLAALPCFCRTTGSDRVVRWSQSIV